MTKEEAKKILQAYEDRDKCGWEIIERTMTKHESNTGNLYLDFFNDYMPPSEEFIAWSNEKCEHGNIFDECETCEKLWLEAWVLNLEEDIEVV